MLCVRVLIVLICLTLEAPTFACPAMVLTGTRSAGHKTRHEDKKNKQESSNAPSKPTNANKAREVQT